MTENTRRLMNAEPFIPFVIKTSDGKELQIVAVRSRSR